MEELYSIGKLSKIVGLSVDTLRHYDAIGLISPTRISDETGYRYYAPEQAAEFMRVQELKEYGFSLKEIKELPQDTMQIFQHRYAQLMRERQKLSDAMDKLAKKIKQQQEVAHMGKQILLVEDAAFMRMMCRDILAKHGYEIAGEAENGRVAVDFYAKLLPDLVIMDIAMTEMDGIMALRKIREINPQANVIMLSAMGQATMVVDAYAAGARGFVAKPFHSETLIEAARESFTGEKPCNHDVLTALLPHYADDGKVLPQPHIDEILRIAQTAKTIDEAIAMVSCPNLPSQSPAVLSEPPATANHDTVAILNLLVQGQEKMTALLEQLVKEKS